MVCDIQEIFRVLIENYLLGHQQNLEPESFEHKGKRYFLKPEKKLELILGVRRLFKKKVPYNRRNITGKTMIKTIIKEETIEQAKYIREEKEKWAPRIPIY
jgi:hypothetical protein